MDNSPVSVDKDSRDNKGRVNKAKAKARAKVNKVSRVSKADKVNRLAAKAEEVGSVPTPVIAREAGTTASEAGFAPRTRAGDSIVRLSTRETGGRRLCRDGSTPPIPRTLSVLIAKA